MDPESARTRLALERWAGRFLTALPILASLLWLGGTFHRAYGPTHYFLNYQHGFLKRALCGYAKKTRWSLLLLLCAPLLLLPLGHDVMRWVAAICVNLSLFLLYLHSTAPELAERRALTTWTATPLYPAMLWLHARAGRLWHRQHPADHEHWQPAQRPSVRSASLHAAFRATGLHRAIAPPAKLTE